jgi:RecB family exonuclease
VQDKSIELIAAIKDMHSGTGSTCPECKQPHPCRTYAHVDGVLAARFEDAATKEVAGNA